MENNIISPDDMLNFNKGISCNSYDFLGCHFKTINGVKGALFSVWAPNAKIIRVVGNFNNWNGEKHSMTLNDPSGIWNLFIPDIQEGDNYMYEVFSKSSGKAVLKADPYAFSSQLRPKNGSIAMDLSGFSWLDNEWLHKRSCSAIYSEPLNIYEVHLGSWKRHEDNSFYTYLELAEELPEYVSSMGYTHIEVLPIMEHPLDDSWGYQTTGYYSVTPRYGTPKEFMFFIDKCHQKGLGVILDWVPGHFCKDQHGLYNFDGTHLFESSNPAIAENYDWGTANFDFDKPEIKSFLISNALFWFNIYHVDGIRVDAVANMLYLNYGKKSHSNIRNRYGGNENIEAVDFLKKLNEAIFKSIKSPLVIAEDSSTWPMLTSPTYIGGVGFNYKWNMGWMNDMLKFLELDSIFRKWHHNLITFSLMYAFSENFILPLSHDEVVHGKKSLINKMPGDYWQKFANLRLFYGYMMAHPGKKLLFMGGEFGQFIEWNFKQQLDWLLLAYPSHIDMQKYVKSLNFLYRREPAFYELDHGYEGFEWIDHSNYEQSIISFMRKSKNKKDYLIFVCNFTPVVYYDYKIGVPERMEYVEIFNSDDTLYGGSGQTNASKLTARNEKWNNQRYCVMIKIPPLAIMILKAKRSKKYALQKFVPIDDTKFRISKKQNKMTL